MKRDNSASCEALNRPHAQEDVEKFMSLPGNRTAEAVLKRFDEQRNKYKFMETNLEQKKRR